MDKNLDIDRISLEDRIKRLEGRLPGSGGGSGGHTDFLLDPKIVDQCPENAITDVGNGWVFYLSIPNFYNITSRSQGGQTNYPGRCYNNLELKLVRFYPRISGVTLNCTTELVRVRATAPITNLPTASRTFSMDVDIPFNDSSMRDFIFTVYPESTQYNFIAPKGITSFAAFLFTTANPTTNLGQSIFNMQIVYYLRKPQTNYSWYFNFSSSGFTSFPAGCAWGCATVEPFTAFPNHFISNTVGQPNAIPSHFGECTRRQPSDLPQELRHMYPQSWYA